MGAALQHAQEDAMPGTLRGSLGEALECGVSHKGIGLESETGGGK